MIMQDTVLETKQELSFFDYFKIFRDNHPMWGGKEQFKKYYKKISLRKGEDYEQFILKCLIAKHFFDKGQSFLCDVKVESDIVPVHEISSNKNYFYEDNLPEDVKNSIKVIIDYVNKKY
jgi:hypothetical protein